MGVLDNLLGRGNDQFVVPATAEDQAAYNAKRKLASENGWDVEREGNWVFEFDGIHDRDGKVIADKNKAKELSGVPTVSASTPGATVTLSDGTVFDPSAGRGRIDAAFSNALSPSYMSKNYHDILSFYTPDIQKQYDVAKDRLTQGIAGRGLGSSNVGAKFFNQLDALKSSAERKAQGFAQGFQDDLTSRANQAKTSLYSKVQPGYDAAGVEGEAANVASGLATKKPSPTPLGDLFGSFLRQFTGASGGAEQFREQPALAKGESLNLAPVAQSSQSKSSSQVVGNKKKSGVIY